jgi:hypothetical protein
MVAQHHAGARRRVTEPQHRARVQPRSKRFAWGHHYEAKRYKPRTLTEEVANIYKAQEKAFKKDGWVINVQKCQHCKGAGMVLSEQQNVW